MRIAIVLNCGSGNQQHSPEQLKRLFESHPAEVEVLPSSRGQQISDLVQTAAGDHYDMVVAAGGDGTVNAVASALVRDDQDAVGRSRPALGVLPMGTLNHLAKDLAMPLDLSDASRALLNGKPVSIDVGQVNDAIFLNMSSVGLYPRIVDLRERRRGAGWPKWIAHGLATIAAVTEFVIHPVKIEIKGATTRVLRRWSPTITITNNEYTIEGRNLGGRKSLSRGCLNLVIAQTHSRWSLFKVTLMALLGRLRRAREVEIVTCTEVILHMHARHVRVSLDGEVREMRSPLHYRIRPAALRIIAPPQNSTDASTATSTASISGTSTEPRRV